MKTKLMLIGLWLFTMSLTAFAQGTGFTYQGKLGTGTNAANGTYDFQFQVFDAATGGSNYGSPNPNQTNAVAVNNGLFAVVLDFGSGVFTGADRWLQVSVRTNGVGLFANLMPRQKLTPTPYAVFAGSAGTAATATAATTAANATTATGFTGSLAGDVTGTQGTTTVAKIRGANVSGSAPAANQHLRYDGASWAPSSVALATDVTGTLPDAALAANVARTNQVWLLGGNAGANPTNGVFLGTTDNLPLELKVNGARALRVEPNPAGAPNFIGGAFANSVANGIVGATIGGGGNTNYLGQGYPEPNFIAGDFAAIGGGRNNTIGTAPNSTIAGGWLNSIGDDNQDATISGGQFNILETQTYESVIAGGFINQIQRSAVSASVGGGQQNVIGTNASASVISGGLLNTIKPSATFATIAGGRNNTVQTNSRAAFVGGGESNMAAGNCSTTAGGSNNLAGAAFATVSGGATNRATGSYSAVVGGALNVASGGFSFVGGGGGVPGQGIGYFGNVAAGDWSAVLGGDNVLASGLNSVAVGGEHQLAAGQFSMVLGGRWNEANGDFSFASGTAAKADHRGAFVWADSVQGITNILGTNYILWPFEFRSTNQNEFAVRATGGVRFVSGVETNGNPKFGVVLSPNGTSWGTLSDREAKKNFQPVDSKAVLEKLARVPVESWNYKGEADQSTPHLGPMAQDFKGAFFPGRDDKIITTLEFDGVELAAIQGLNQKLDEQVRDKNARIEALEKSVTELKALVGRLAFEHAGGAR